METTDQAIDSTVQDAEPTGQTQPASDSVDYKARFAGMQGAYNKLQAQHTAVSAQLKDVLAELEASRSILAEQEELKSGLQTVQANLAAKEIELARLKIIAGEFPDLMEAESKGLLPTDPDPDTLRTKLTNLRELFLKSAASAAPQQTVRGSVPPSTASKSVVMTAEALLNAAKEAARKGDLTEYNRLYSEYVNASN